MTTIRGLCPFASHRGRAWERPSEVRRGPRRHQKPSSLPLCVAAGRTDDTPAHLSAKSPARPSELALRRSDGVAGWFGGVLPSRGGGSAEGSRGDLLDFPSGVLFKPVVATAGRPAVTRTGPASRFVRDVMFEIALLGWPAAGRSGARGMPDLGQVPQLDPRIMTAGLKPVVTGVQGDRVQGDDQVRLAGDPGG